MTITLEHGKWYQLNNGEVLEAKKWDRYYVTFNGLLVDKLHHDNISHEVHPNTIQNMNVKAGDVVKCVCNVGRKWDFTNGKEYTITKEGTGNFKYFHECEQLFIIVSRAGEKKPFLAAYADIDWDAAIKKAIANVMIVTDADPDTTPPRTWGELTEAEQNKIAGHYARGGEVEFLWGDNKIWTTAPKPSWEGHVSFRIKPSPVVVDVSINVKPNKHGEWVSDISRSGGHEVTFQTIDGKPDWSTLKGADV